MPNLFSGINTALQSLLSQQQVIEVIDHNVANASTPGYRRQTAVLAAGIAYNPISSPGMMGSGVTVTQIQRYNVDYYNRQFRTQAGESSRWELQRDVIRQVEATLAETSTDGLLKKMDSFWAGWVSLASDPTNLSYRSDLRDRSDALADAFNSRVQQLRGIQSDLSSAVIERVDEINFSAEQIATLNEEISRALATGNQPNDLLDQRDMLLDRLASLAGAESSQQANGEVMVSIAGHVLVTGHDSFRLKASDDSVVQISWTDNQPFAPATGELKGLLQARDVDIPGQIAGLDSLARALITAVNGVHTTGITMNNTTNVAFFTGTDATSIAVNSALSDPRNIATATLAGDPGDSSKVQAMMELRTTSIAGLNNATLNQFYETQITRLGLDVQNATSRAKEHNLQKTTIDTRRESVSGVSLDEEAANMVKAQRAYEASSRLLTVIDDMLDTIINRMGRVGL